MSKQKARTEKEILKDVKALAVEYYNLTGKPLGVTGEIAEYEAAEILGLMLAEARTPGWDAVAGRGKKKKTVQIKGRYKKDGKNWDRVSTININKEFDTVVLVLMHKDFQVHQIWEAERQPVIDKLLKPGSKARNERFQMSMSQFMSIGDLVWPPSN